MDRGIAESLGWSFDDGDDGLEGWKNGTPAFVISSDTPLFFALRSVAEIEGLPFPDAHDPATIRKVSGEKYVGPKTAPVEKTPREKAIDAVLAAKTIDDVKKAVVTLAQELA